MRAASCGATNPCVKVDIANTLYISTNKFKVKANYPNGLSFTSTEARVSIKCGSNTNRMTNPWFDATVITNATFYQNMTDVNATFFFPPFSCTYDPVCCQNITYQIAQNDSWASLTWYNYTDTVNGYVIETPDSMLNPNFTSVNKTNVNVTTPDPNGYIPFPLP